jgi:hypothetical protein
MTKPSQSGASKQQKRSFDWYPWFPYPTAWLKAFTLLIILGVITRLPFPFRILEYIASDTRNAELVIASVILILLSPITIIAFIHHLLHLVTSQFAPGIQAPEVGKVKGLIPTLSSWWEGLYGWLVIVIATLLSFSLCIFLFPLFNLSFYIQVVDYSSFQEIIITIFGILWLINASLLYQVEYLYRKRIISAYSIQKS